jgi:hypothetical protein
VRLGWVRTDGELLDGLALRSEVEMVVLTELSVRKTLAWGQCGCKDQALAGPNQRVAISAWHKPLPAKARPN